eukprot:s4721_g2.t2
MFLILILRLALFIPSFILSFLLSFILFFSPSTMPVQHDLLASTFSAARRYSAERLQALLPPCRARYVSPEGVFPKVAHNPAKERAARPRASALASARLEVRSPPAGRFMSLLRPAPAPDLGLSGGTERTELEKRAQAKDGRLSSCKRSLVEDPDEESLMSLLFKRHLAAILYRMLDYIADARLRLAQPGAIVVPAGGAQFAALVSSVQPECSQGFDLSAIGSLQDTGKIFFTKQWGFRLNTLPDLVQMSDRVCIFEVDFQNGDRRSVPPQKTFKIRAKRSGIVHAVVSSWEVWSPMAEWQQAAKCSNEDTFNTPWGFARDMQWGQGLQLIEDFDLASSAGSERRAAPSPFKVSAGEDLILTACQGLRTPLLGPLGPTREGACPAAPYEQELRKGSGPIVANAALAACEKASAWEWALTLWSDVCTTFSRCSTQNFGNWLFAAQPLWNEPLDMEQDGEHTDLPHVNLVFIGPCSSGKSTMVGHLIADSGAIDAENLQRIFDEADRRGQPDRRYAWILDKLNFERKRGHSMSVALWRLASRRCRFTVMDAPGHKDFSKDIVTAMSQADIAVLVVSTSKSDLEQGEEGEIQLREHTLLAYTLGLRRLVVCVNKMDSDSARFSEDRFATACRVVRERLKTAGLKTNDVFFDVHFVPTSGWCGDNVISRSDNMPWFGGPTLIEALDEAVASHFRPERPLRFPLAEVMKVGGKGTVVVGRVATGSLRCGAKLTFAPGGATAEVTAIAMHHEPLNEAVVGNTVTVTVDAEMSELRRGMVGSAVDDSPASECSSFLAQVIVLSDPRAGEIRDGSELTVVCHTAQVLCAFQELVSRSDRRTGKVLQMRPLALRGGDAALVRLRPHTPLCVEPFEEYPALGRFSVHDQKVTVAVGVVQKVEQGPPSAPRRPPPTSPSSAEPPAHSGERSTAKPKASRSEKQVATEPRRTRRSTDSQEEPLPLRRGHRLRNFSEDSGEEQRLRNYSADSGEAGV